MTNAELIQAIRNEIERLKTVQLKRIQEGDLVDAEPYDKNEAYNELLSFLDTLESEKPMNQKGLEREIERCLWQLSDDPSNDELRMFARHFAQWGAEHLANSNDEIVINGHKVAYNKDKDAITMEEIPNDLEEAARHSEILTYPMPEDGDIEKVFKVQEARVFHEIGFIAGAKWQKEQDEKEQADLFTIVALDAAQRAKEQMMKDGLDAVKSGQSNKIEKTIAGVFVKYGMDRQKEQMMKEAIHYVVQDDLDSHGASYNIPFIRIGTTALKPKGIGVGDKVRIIIVKED